MEKQPDLQLHEGDDMEYNGITVYSDPRRGSVRRVQNLKTSWYLKHIPLEKLDQKMTLDQAFQECLKSDPALMGELMEFQQDVEEIQTIMLATTLTYDGVRQLEDELSVEEFDNFVQICRDAVGGGVQDFFGGSGSDINSKNQNEKPENRESMNSPDQHGGSTAESTMPTKVNLAN
jgi:hypothetical protein